MKFFITIVLLVIAQPIYAAQSSTIPLFDQSENFPGGGATTKSVNSRSFLVPGKHLTLDEQLPFWAGLSFFRDPWVIAPASTKDRDGLGPLFNARSCITCHRAGARGPMAVEGVSKPTALLLRLLGKTSNAINEDPVYGAQIQPRGIDIKHVNLPDSVKGEADVMLNYEYVEGTFKDGERYQLRKPYFGITNAEYGALDEKIGISARYAPNIYGMGLLDAVNTTDILSNEDVSDSNNDGISGKANWVINVETGKKEVGRYGFKALHPTLTQQVAAAFVNDIGITNHLFPDEACSSTQKECKFAPSLSGQPGVEINEKLLANVVTFNRHLGVPPARGLSRKNIQLGRTVFFKSQCYQCHQPSFVTGEGHGTLSNQTIWPYTDLLLHDMGEGLADPVVENQATGREWRTAPLWGIGLQKKLTGKTLYLHDGRARNVMEAILWHGGEAEKAKNHVLSLSKKERHALVAFLNAI